MSEQTKIPASLPVQFRAARVESIDKEARTVTYTLTSEQPVRRWWGNEVLDHKPASIRQDRLKRGIPQLFGHDSSAHIGRIESYEVKNGKLTVTARFGNSPLAEEKWRDVQDGILVDASGGYIVHGYVLESRDGKTGEETYRITDWEPVEGSLVTIPADPTVGVGRELEKGKPTFPVRDLASDAMGRADDSDQCQCTCTPCAQGNCDDCTDEDCEDDSCRCGHRALDATTTTTPAQPEKTERSIMSATATSAGAPAVEIGTNNLMAERQRVSEINAIATRWSKHLSREQAERFVNDGTEVSAVRKFVMDAQIEDAQANEVRNLNKAGLSEHEKENYSILRALRDAAMGNNCFELEVSQELSKKLGREAKSNGIFVPMDIKMRASDNERAMLGRGAFAQRAGLDATAAGKGPETIFTEYVSLIELLRNKMKVRSLGATVLAGLSETIAFPKQATAGTATWVADNPGSDVADSNLTFAQITLSPKLLQSTTSFSRKLLLQSSVDVEALVRNDLTMITALAIDLAAINGSGASNQPRGIFNQTGVGSLLTANAALTKNPFVDLETLVANANADELGPLAYLTTPAVRGKLKKTPELNNTIALPIYYKGEINDHRAEATAQMPTFSITTPTTYTGHGCIFGVWNQLLIGEWGALEVIVDPYRLKKQGMIEITTFDTCDVNVRHPEAFAVCNDMNPLS